MSKNARRYLGFTLIELLVVMAIISLLSSIVLASVGTAKTKVRDVRRLEDFRQFQLGLELYYQKYGLYPCADGGTDGLYESSGSSLFLAGIRKNGNGTWNYPTEAYPTGCRLNTAYNNTFTKDYQLPQWGLVGEGLYPLETPVDPINQAATSPDWWTDTRYWYYVNPERTKYVLIANLESESFFDLMINDGGCAVYSNLNSPNWLRYEVGPGVGELGQSDC